MAERYQTYSHSYNTRSTSNRTLHVSVDTDHSGSSSNPSNLAKSEPLSNIPYFKEQRDSEICGIATCCYSLVDIASYLSIDAESTISDIQQEYRYLNDHFAKRCMEAIIQRERLPFYVEANCEVNKMRDLPELCSSSAERSDIIVYTDSQKKE